MPPFLQAAHNFSSPLPTQLYDCADNSVNILAQWGFELRTAPSAQSNTLTITPCWFLKMGDKPVISAQVTAPFLYSKLFCLIDFGASKTFYMCEQLKDIRRITAQNKK